MEMENKNIRKRILTMACGFFALSSIAQEIAAAGNLTFENTVKSNKSIVQVPLEQCSVDTCDVTRYAIVQKNDRWGIYDLSRHENVTNIDYDYAKFLHRDVVEGDSTVAYCFYAEKGIEQGLILVSGDNNQTVEMWHDNPEYVGNLDECKTIDKGTEKKCFSLLKKGMKYMDGVDGQVAVVDARTGSLKAWVALEKNNNTFVNAKLLKKAFSMRPVILECVTSVLADADGSLEDSIDVCGGIYDSMSGLEIRDHNWRSGSSGMMTAREALVKKSNVAMYKILLSVLCEDRASIIWQKMMDNAQVTNAMEIADLLVGIYNGNVNPAKRNVLDLKNETCKIREKRNVLKVSRTRHSKATKSSPNRAAFTVFERQTNGVQIMFNSCCIRLHKHHIFVASIIVHVCVELKPLTTFKRVAERFVLSKPFAKFND